MTGPLRAFVAQELAAPLRPEVAAAAAALAGPSTAAMLFYGSNRRTGSLDGVIDLYRLDRGVRERGLWPRVGYHELVVDGTPIRVKLASMTLATFAAAARGETLDTTIWTRFVQPATLAWRADDAAADAVVDAVAAACVTAARIAAVLATAPAVALDHWRTLFRATYRTELRVEPVGRSDTIVMHDPGRWAALLPLAWDAGGIAVGRAGDLLQPEMEADERGRWHRRWRRWRRLGRPLNAVRLVRATSTFEGAARYAAWKIERHTGIAIALSPIQERHPLIAAPGVLWRVWRARR